jgi:DNA polymerase II large subunit
MSDASVSWIGLALSALLILDKLLSKSKKVKCKCCGSEFEASESLSTPMTPKAVIDTAIQMGNIKTEIEEVVQVKEELTNKKD